MLFRYLQSSHDGNAIRHILFYSLHSRGFSFGCSCSYCLIVSCTTIKRHGTIAIFLSFCYSDDCHNFTSRRHSVLDGRHFCYGASFILLRNMELVELHEKGLILLITVFYLQTFQMILRVLFIARLFTGARLTGPGVA